MFRTLLPDLPTDVRKALEDSIRSEGLRDPLVTWRKKGAATPILIDGYNRFDICEEYKIEYSIIEKSFNDEEEVKLWMWENQESRRNMTAYQRIEVVLQFKDIIEEQAKQNQRDGGGSGCEKIHKAKLKKIRTSEVLGNRAGVSYRQVVKVLDIQEKRNEGVISQKELDKLREGKVSISYIHNKYCATQPTAPKQTIPLSKAKQVVLQDVTSEIRDVLSTLNDADLNSTQSDGRTSLYNKIIDWATARRDG